MKTIWTIAAFLTVALTTARAALTFQWQVDLTTHTGTSDYVNSAKQYSDDSYAVAAGSTLMVFDSNGSLKFKDTLPGNNYLYLEGYSSNPRYISLSVQNSTTYVSFLRMYEIHDGTYSTTDIPISRTFESSYSSNAGIDPTTIYSVEGTILRKYKLSTVSTVVDAAVASGIDGSNYIMHWNSVGGVSYQIQCSTNLVDWTDVGFPLVGTGSALTWANALTNSKSFYRVVEQ